MDARHGKILALSFCLAAVVCGPGLSSASPDGGQVDLAIVPFANNTGQSAAHTMLMPLLEKHLAERGLRFVGSDSLRPMLRHNRVRSRGWISRRGAELVGNASGARYLLLGSWDVLQTEGPVEVGVSLRVLDLSSWTLVRAVSLGATGEDKVSWLDQGRIENVELLASALLQNALNELWPDEGRGVAEEPEPGCRQLAVIPLDNYAATAHAGDIVTNILLSRLLAAGYFVVEPGFVRELGLTREVVNRGGVDRASAQAILDSLGACQVITGAVQEFALARGLPTVSVPQFAVGLRVSSTAEGTLLAMRELEGTGGDHDGFFQLGRVHAITILAAAQITRFVADLPTAVRKDLSHGPLDQ